MAVAFQIAPELLRRLRSVPASLPAALGVTRDLRIEQRPRQRCALSRTLRLTAAPLSDETDAATFRRGQCGELSNGVDEPGDRLVMGRELLLEGIELAGQFFVRAQHFAEANEGPYDIDNDFNRTR